MNPNETLLHLPLEKYKSRYTEFLEDWEKAEFEQHFNVHTIIPRDQLICSLLDIVSGSVLDSVARPQWAMQQIAQLITQARKPFFQKVYFSDFYTTGLDALPYSDFRGKLYSFCWAQSFDMYDFTMRFVDWMRPWEVMALSLYDKVFVASTGLKDLICTAVPGVSEKIEVVGLPFNTAHVGSQVDMSKAPGNAIDVVYSSRLDREKNPDFFLDLVEYRDDLKFAICTGSPKLTSNVSNIVRRAYKVAEKKRNLTIFEGLEKPEYYAILAQSRVQFNCALQDWVSFTLLEALTYGCKPLYPCFRSFPEGLNWDQRVLYRPNDLHDANLKLDALLHDKSPGYDRAESILAYHDKTLNRIANIIAL
jgi:glycosyltransferase involved in cell wall biosynthesis